MNQSFLLHVVERIESFAGKLPATIQKPILNELTPLKELFLRQRPPRLLFIGSDKIDIADIAGRSATKDSLWEDVDLAERGTMSILNARAGDWSAIESEIKRQPPDAIVFLHDNESSRGPRKIDIDHLRQIVLNSANAKVIATGGERVQSALKSDSTIEGHLLESPGHDIQSLMSVLARELPNEARIEMIRISRDREAQQQVAQILIKSTTAICTAIGAQPIPLADMPILTTLQLVMVSGIMYISGRERSLRAATEFVGALGANVGIGMLLREGTRAVLKFFPGWGNVVCGMVAGAGTYAMGRAAIAFFIEGGLNQRRPQNLSQVGKDRNILSCRDGKGAKRPALERNDLFFKAKSPWPRVFE